MRTRLFFLPFLLLGFSLFLSSCELIDIFDPDTPGGGGSQTAILKGLILQAAQNAQGDCDGSDNLEPARISLNELVEQLLAITPSRTEAEKSEQVVGSWQQVWSDNDIANIPGVCFEAEDMYQVVFPDGFYYLLSQVRFAGLNFTSYVRGQYEVEDTALPIEITNNFFATGGLSPGINLRRQAQRAEDGRISRAPFVPGLPINGDTGQWANVFVDDELRIVTDGRSPAESDFLYVLRRVQDVQ